MSDNGAIQNDTPSESEKMDISEVSDHPTPVSDQSPSEAIDNRRPDANPHFGDPPMDNAASLAAAAAVMESRFTSRHPAMATSTPIPSQRTRSDTNTTTTSGATTATAVPTPTSRSGSEERVLSNGAGGDSGLSREHSDSRLSLDGFDIELPTIETYQEEYAEFPSSPVHESLQHLTPGEHDSGNAERTGSLISSQRGGRRRIRVTADILGGAGGDSDDDDDRASSPGGSSRLSDAGAGLLTHADEDADLDALLSPGADTPDELEDSILERLGDVSPAATTPAPPAPIPEFSAAEERAESRSWRSVVVQGIERRIDMKVIEPYKRVLSHGGYLSAGSHNAIIVFSACFLPDHSRVDYDYVMDNLFLYVLTTLDQLVTEDYVLVYLHGATPRSCMPNFSWLKRCYLLIDRRLRKNLKGLYLVHPTFWLKTIVVMTKPFVSSKFSRKLRFVESLQELGVILPLEQASIPERVKQLDAEREARAAKRRRLLAWWWGETAETVVST